VTPAASPATVPGPEAPTASPPSRPADVSPLAAVIGIALLGGMLLIGVLIGRGGANDEPAPAPVIQVGEGTTTTATAGSGDGGGTATAAVTSEWPPGTDGFTIQLTTVSKDGATTATVDAAEQKAVADGAADAAVLDSDLYASLPPGNYVVYSGVYTDRRSAEVALKGLRKSFPSAAVVEVSSGGGAPAATQDQPPATDSGSPGGVVPGAGGESEVPPGTEN
jgi:hypothetical protein